MLMSAVFLPLQWTLIVLSGMRQVRLVLAPLLVRLDLQLIRLIHSHRYYESDEALVNHTKSKVHKYVCSTHFS